MVNELKWCWKRDLVRLEGETHLGDRCLCIESDCVVSVRGNLDEKAGAENEDGNRKVHDGGGYLAVIWKSVGSWLILLISLRYVRTQEDFGLDVEDSAIISCMSWVLREN